MEMCEVILIFGIVLFIIGLLMYLFDDILSPIIVVSTFVCLGISLVVGFIEKNEFADSFDYKAELKSGEIVDAKKCYLVNEKNMCTLKTNDNYFDVEEYVVVSYEKKEFCGDQ